MPTKIYVKALMPVMRAGKVIAAAHITGGGLPDNVPRVLPDGLGVRVETAAIPRQPLCELIVQRGGVSREEAYRVLNMGIGMVLFVRKDDVDRVLEGCRSAGEAPFLVGEVAASTDKVTLA